MVNRSRSLLTPLLFVSRNGNNTELKRRFIRVKTYDHEYLCVTSDDQAYVDNVTNFWQIYCHAISKSSPSRVFHNIDSNWVLHHVDVWLHRR
jgi:hypothetical protein